MKKITKDMSRAAGSFTSPLFCLQMYNVYYRLFSIEIHEFLAKDRIEKNCFVAIPHPPDIIRKRFDIKREKILGIFTENCFLCTVDSIFFFQFFCLFSRKTKRFEFWFHCWMNIPFHLNSRVYRHLMNGKFSNKIVPDLYFFLIFR